MKRHFGVSFSMWSISSTADVQGRALCPGSTPGAPLKYRLDREVVMGVAKLTDKQKKFIDEYLVDLNATQAAIRAGYKEKTAYRTGAENLRKPQIQREIQKRMQERQQRTEVTQDMVVRELAAIAFAKATDYVEIRSNGVCGTVVIKPTTDLSDQQIRAIAGIKEGANGIEIKLNDKEKALELLGRHLGMWNDKLDIKTPAIDDSIKEMEAYFEQLKESGSGPPVE